MHFGRRETVKGRKSVNLGQKLILGFKHVPQILGCLIGGENGCLMWCGSERSMGQFLSRCVVDSVVGIGCDLRDEALALIGKRNALKY